MLIIFANKSNKVIKCLTDWQRQEGQCFSEKGGW